MTSRMRSLADSAQDGGNLELFERKALECYSDAIVSPIDASPT